MSITENIATKLTAIAENVPKVYQSGKNEGIGIGYGDGYRAGLDDGFGDGWMDNETMVVNELEEPVQKVKEYVPDSIEPNRDSVAMIRYIDETIPLVYENGQKSEYDRFWDSMLNNGARTSFLYGFAGQCWTPETFVPKYDLVVTNGNNMFMYTRMQIDLVEHFENIGRTIDFSQNAGWNNTFYQSYFTRVGVIDTRKVNAVMATFGYTIYLKTIDKLILKSDGSQTFTSAFEAARALKNIVIEGVIGNSISFQWSPLSKDSITSIVDALKSTASGKTLTLNEAAVVNAFGSTDAQEWIDLITGKSKDYNGTWTISLMKET